MSTQDMFDDLDVELRATLFTMTLAHLKEVAAYLKITAGTLTYSRQALAKHINRYLDSDEFAELGPETGLAVLQDLKEKMDHLTETTTSTTTTTGTTTSGTTTTKANSTTTTDSQSSNKVSAEIKAALELAGVVMTSKKEFKIQGQIGKPGQQDKLTFSSLARQIEDALQKAVPVREIVNAVTRAVAYSVPLRSYLEGRVDLTLPQLRRLLRSHFHEKDALDLYQELTSASQKSNETAQEFLMRVMNLRQKVIFASQEDQSTLKYDHHLVQSTFLQTVATGLTGVLRGEMRQHLQNSKISDEDLLEALSAAVTLEEKRSLKRGARAQVKSVATDDVTAAPTSQPKTKRDRDIVALADGFADLKAVVLSLQQQVEKRSNEGPRPSSNEGPRPSNEWREQRRSMPRRERGCQPCRQQGQGHLCKHCFKCGSAEHYARGCRQHQRGQQQGNGNRLPQGEMV